MGVVAPGERKNLLASQEGLCSLELIISNESQGQGFYGFLDSVVY